MSALRLAGPLRHAWLVAIGGVLFMTSGAAADDPPGVFDPIVIDDSPPAGPVRSQHEAHINGQELAYDVLTGETLLRNADGEPAATIFSTAYLRTDAGESRERPVVFLFNGGPGASSSPLHLGIGPVRRSPDDPDASLVSNEHSVLDAIDMVFVDPVGTGYTRLYYEGAGSDYWGVNEDADANLEFIRRWLADNGRKNSPVFIMGESYGAMRAATMLARARHVHFRAALMLSPAVDFSPGDSIAGDIRPYVFLVPSLAVTAAYHGVTDTRGKSYPELFDEAARFAQSDYATALSQGDRLPDDDRRRVAVALAARIGLSVDYVLEQDLRLDWSGFRDHLLDTRQLRVGRLDARITGPVAEFAGQRPPYNDPSMSGGGGAGRSTSELLTEYFRERLETDIDRYYRSLNLDANSKWNYKRGDGPQILDAFNADPGLQLWVGGGLFDLATPVMASRYGITQLPVARERITLAAYEAGHTAFDHEESRRRMGRDIRAFVADVLKASPRANE